MRRNILFIIPVFLILFFYKNNLYALTNVIDIKEETPETSYEYYEVEVLDPRTINDFSEPMVDPKTEAYENMNSIERAVYNRGEIIFYIVLSVVILIIITTILVKKNNKKWKRRKWKKWRK